MDVYGGPDVDLLYGTYPAGRKVSGRGAIAASPGPPGGGRRGGPPGGVRFDALLGAAKKARLPRMHEDGMPGDLRSRSEEAATVPTELRQAVQDLEAYFINTLIKDMRRTVPDGGLFEKGFAARMYEQMLDEKLADTMSQAGGIGLGDIIMNQLAPEYRTSDSHGVNSKSTP